MRTIVGSVSGKIVQIRIRNINKIYQRIELDSARIELRSGTHNPLGKGREGRGEGGGERKGGGEEEKKQKR